MLADAGRALIFGVDASCPARWGELRLVLIAHPNMKVSFNWLAQHLDTAGRSTTELADLLTFAGVEVEEIQERGIRSEFIIVGQVTAFEPHPNADKLRLCQVDDGSGTPRQIVCGAKNFASGDKVPVALPGAVLPGNFQIKESKLRGVLSQGMMCSGRELGLGDDHEGLMILPATAPVGLPLHELVETDTLFTVEVTPNRPDLLSHLGMARELSALSSIPLKSAPSCAATAVPQQEAGPGEIRIEAPALCPYYSARRIEGVKVGPSPDWLRRRLESVGLRPINNIVDITNFVLMEMGQPLHAFDAARLSGGIIARSAREGESLTALDGKNYLLDTGDLVIADSAGPVAIAGVMGGEATSVSASTTDIILESAYFQSTTVRRTSRRLGLISDSSYRFERGTDAHQVAGASELATRLILEVAGGTAAPALSVAGKLPALPQAVALDGKHVRRLLGAEISDEEIDDILTRLGLRRSSNASNSDWQPPSWRLDLPRAVDLIEEVARVHGIDKLPSAAAAFFAEASAADVAYDFCMDLRRQLAARGLWEATTIKLVSAAQLSDALGTSPQPLAPLALKNPLGDDHTTMRPSLLPGLLATLERNIRMSSGVLRFFEVGTVFAVTPDGKAVEREALGIVITGPSGPSSWDTAPGPADAADLRGLIESLCSGAAVKLKPARHPGLLLSATIQINGKPVGQCGRLHPARERSLGTRHPVYTAELDLTALHKALRREVLFEELSRFPASTRDIAMEAAADLPNSKFEDFFSSLKEPLLAGAALFDVFTDPTGEKLAVGRRSLAYSLTYRDPARTLESAEVDAAHSRVLQAVQKSLAVTIR